MYKQVKKTAVWWTVHVPVPCDGGEVQKFKFEAQYALIKRTENEKLEKEFANDITGFLARVVLNWRGITDEDEQPLPFTPDMLAGFCEMDYQRQALINGYYEARIGAARKN